MTTEVISVLQTYPGSVFTIHHQFFQNILNPFLNDKCLDRSKLKEFADHHFNFDENGRKLSKRVENTVGKGEIARHEQFLLFLWCF